MSVLTPNHRIAHLIDADYPAAVDDFPPDVMEDDEPLIPPCLSAPVRNVRLVPSGTTQSWLVNRVTWFYMQEFTRAHEYAHFMFHLMGDPYAQDVVDYCWKHGLTDKLDLVVELINQTFPEARSVTVAMEKDPESEQQWILVDALVKGPAKEIRLRHRECVRRLLKMLPWPMSTLIRTTYTLI